MGLQCPGKSQERPRKVLRKKDHRQDSSAYLRVAAHSLHLECPRYQHKPFIFQVQDPRTPKYVKSRPRKSLPCSGAPVSFSMISPPFVIIVSGWGTLGTIKEHVTPWIMHCTILNAMTLVFRMCSLGNILLLTVAPIFIYCRVLISNLRSMLEAQFDSHVRATGHSYVKYNNWETV